MVSCSLMADDSLSHPILSCGSVVMDLSSGGAETTSIPIGNLSRTTRPIVVYSGGRPSDVIFSCMKTDSTIQIFAKDAGKSASVTFFWYLVAI